MYMVHVIVSIVFIVMFVAVTLFYLCPAKRLPGRDVSSHFRHRHPAQLRAQPGHRDEKVYQRWRTRDPQEVPSDHTSL